MENNQPISRQLTRGFRLEKLSFIDSLALLFNQYYFPRFLLEELHKAGYGIAGGVTQGAGLLRARGSENFC